MTHNALQKKVINQLSFKGNGFSIVSSNRRGRPDISGHIAMISIYAEVKVGKDKLRPAQRITLCDIVAKGGIGIVVHEKHYEVFVKYVQLIEQQVKAHTPCTYIGKPIPAELSVEPPKDVLSVTVLEV